MYDISLYLISVLNLCVLIFVSADKGHGIANGTLNTVFIHFIVRFAFSQLIYDIVDDVTPKRLVLNAFQSLFNLVYEQICLRIISHFAWPDLRVSMTPSGPGFLVVVFGLTPFAGLGQGQNTSKQ